MSDAEQSTSPSPQHSDTKQYPSPPKVTITANMRSSDQSTLSATSPAAGPNSPPMRPAANQRQPSNGLRLAPMPKYHPAVYRSPASSSANTPASSRPSSRGLYSPRTHARQFSEVQRQHQEYQRQMLATLRQTALPGTPAGNTPSAPHIMPHGSPGPATPLNLNEAEDYLSARNIGEGSPRALAEKLVREEQERRNGMHAGHSSPAISPRC